MSFGGEGCNETGVEDRGGAFGSALDIAAHGGETGSEPADDVEAVQDVAGVTQVGVDSCLAGSGSVGDDYIDTAPPSWALFG